MYVRAKESYILQMLLFHVTIACELSIIVEYRSRVIILFTPMINDGIMCTHALFVSRNAPTVDMLR